MRRRIPYLLVTAILVLGAGGIVAQTILLRELLILFTGSELSLGIIMGSWVIWEALGAYSGGKNKKAFPLQLRTFAYLTLSFSAFFPLSIYGARCFKALAGMPADSGSGLAPMLYISLAVLLPTGFCHGYLFTLACSIWNQATGEGGTSGGKVYFYETMGTIGGGILANFLLIPYFDSFRIALTTALVSSIAVGALVFRLLRPRQYLPLTLSALGAALSVLLLAGNGGEKLHRSAIAKQWPARNVVSYENSVFQNLVVVKTEEQYTFFSDGMPVMTTPVPDIAYAEEFAHIPLLAHPFPRTVLVLGGGAGGVIHEILKHPSVVRIDYVEADPLLLRTVLRFSTSATREELTDSRVRLHYGDGRAFLKNPPSQYDVILLGMPPPHTLRENRFFTEEFFGTVRRALGKGGIFALPMTGSSAYYSTELKELNLCLLSSATKALPYSFVVPGDFNLFLLSASDSLSGLSPALLAGRLKDRAVPTLLVNETHLTYRLDKEKQDWFSSQLIGTSVSPNRDLSPRGLFYQIAYQNLLFSPSTARLFGMMRTIQPLSALLYLVILFLLLLLSLWRLRKGMIAYVMSTTGFSAMVMELMLLFTFQIFYGYVFYEIGILLTLFMAGMAAGSLVVTRSVIMRQSPGTGLKYAESGLILLCLILFVFCGVYRFTDGAGTALSYPLLIGLLFLSGFFTGAEFPLATAAYSLRAGSGRTIAGTVGLLYGADLMGGWLGGLLGGFVLLPLLGLPLTCLLLAVLKGGGLALLLTSRER